jgi:hypothetical protein
VKLLTSYFFKYCIFLVSFILVSSLLLDFYRIDFSEYVLAIHEGNNSASFSNHSTGSSAFLNESSQPVKMYSPPAPISNQSSSLVTSRNSSSLTSLQTTTPSGYLAYENPNHEFKINYPASSKTEELENGVAFNGDSWRFAIFISDDKQYDLEEFVDEQVEFEKGLGMDVKVGEEFSLAGYPAQSISRSGSDEDLMQSTFVVVGGRSYELMATASLEKFTDYSNFFKYMISTFTPLQWPQSSPSAENMTSTNSSLLPSSTLQSPNAVNQTCANMYANLVPNPQEYCKIGNKRY